ncbi:methyltransferase [Candidatus Gracilibacteria bacterium]|nr:methyltransferase [Candidatus Gracilibacteria bacterium]
MQLLHMVTGYYVPQLLYVVANLGIADHIAQGRNSIEELAKLTGTHPPSLLRVLRALASVGVFHENEDGQWSLTELGEGLRSDVPQSQRAWVQLYGGVQQRAWFDLLYSVQTGKPAFPHVFNQPYYDYMASHPEIAALTDIAMDQSVDAWLSDIAHLPLWHAAKSVTDIGGGHGALLARILPIYSHLQGIVFDLPHVTAGASAIVKKAGIESRCTIVSGDMLASIPKGSDTYILSRVLLNWSDEQCITILQNCREALSPTGKLLVIDAVAPDEPLPSGIALWDVFLLVIYGARVRKMDDFIKLLQAANLQVTHVYSTKSQFKAIEIRPK